MRVDWDSHVAHMRKGEFVRRYRMSEDKFDILLSQCQQQSDFFKPPNAKTEQHTRNMFGAASIDVRHKLAAALRWFAGGSYLDIRLCHGMSKEMMYKCVWETVDAINVSKLM